MTEEIRKCPKCGHVRTVEEDKTTPTGQCPACGVYYAKALAPHPAVKKTSHRPTTHHGQPTKQKNTFTLLNLFLALFGASVMAIGTFMPVFSMGATHISYFKSGDGDGVYILIAAGLILISAFLKWKRVIGYLSIISLGLISVGLFWASHRIQEMQADVANQMQGNPFGGIAVMVSQSASLEWGWGVMYVGAIISLLSAMLSTDWLMKTYGRGQSD